MSCIFAAGQRGGGLFASSDDPRIPSSSAAERREQDGASRGALRRERARDGEERRDAARVVVGARMDRAELLGGEGGVAAEAEVIVVRADDDALVRHGGIAPGEDRDDVRGLGSLVEDLDREPRPHAERPRVGLPVGLSGRGERADVDPRAGERRGGDPRRDDPGPRGHLAAPGRQIVRPGVAPHVAHAQDRGGPVVACVRRLVAPLGEAVMPRIPERRGGIRLTREVLRDEHDLPLHVEAGVVVVAERRRGDAVAREDDLALRRAVVAEVEREEVRPERGGRLADRERVPLPERRAERRLEALEVARVERGREAGLPEPLRDPGRRLRAARRPDAPARCARDPRATPPPCARGRRRSGAPPRRGPLRGGRRRRGRARGRRASVTGACSRYIGRAPALHDRELPGGGGGGMRATRMRTPSRDPHEKPYPTPGPRDRHRPLRARGPGPRRGHRHRGARPSRRASGA